MFIFVNFFHQKIIINDVFFPSNFLLPIFSKFQNFEFKSVGFWKTCETISFPIFCENRLVLKASPDSPTIKLSRYKKEDGAFCRRRNMCCKG
jgi:hypothetical protein